MWRLRSRAREKLCVAVYCREKQTVKDGEGPSLCDLFMYSARRDAHSFECVFASRQSSPVFLERLAPSGAVFECGGRVTVLFPLARRAPARRLRMSNAMPKESAKHEITLRRIDMSCSRLEAGREISELFHVSSIFTTKFQ